jgi:hypothetical protein
MMPAPARLLAMSAFLSLAACAHNGACPPAASAQSVAGQSPLPDWHDVITDPDHTRLRAWRKSLVDALTKARGSGHGAEIDAQGRLLDPDAGLDNVALPVGFYRCRVVKLGAKEAGHPDYIAYPAHRCQVKPSDTLTRLIELDGLQRPSGRLYPDGASRMVFLGTMILGDERKAIAYGRDTDRDMVGAVQRIEDKRWRVLFPNPAWESNIDVLELVPEG